MPTPKKQTDTWPVRKLKPHPRQAATFPDLGEVDLAALAADMAANGLQHPVEILPDGTILAGHQRVRAAKRLGWKTIDVVVRRDLAADGGDAATAFFIRDNLNRRHLSPLAKARCIAEWLDLTTGRRVRDLDHEDREARKAAVADRMGMSTRNLNRYLLALQAPPAVQAAFERGHLTLTEAGRVALRADAAAVAAAVAAVYAEAAVRTAVRAVTLAPKPAGGAGKDSLFRLVRALRRDLPAVRAAVGTLDAKTLTRLRGVVAEARDVFAVLTEKAG